MSHALDFNTFVEKVLVEIADRQSGASVIPVDLTEVCKFVMPSAPPTWIGMTSDHFRKRNYGHLNADSEDPEKWWFSIESAGVAEASRFRQLHKPPTFTDRLASEKTQRLINVGNFLIAIAALIVAAFALSRTGN